MAAGVLLASIARVGSSCRACVLAWKDGVGRSCGLAGTLGVLGLRRAPLRYLLEVLGGRFAASLFAWASFSSCVLFGGKGGKADGSNSGARIAKRSDRDVIDVPFDLADTDDLVVLIELIDSFDSRLLKVMFEGRLGGRAGDCSEGFRGGKVGPWDNCVDVLGGSAGLEVPSIPYATAPVGLGGASG